MNPLIMKAAVDLGQKALCAAGLAALKILSDKLQEKQAKMEKDRAERATKAEEASIITVEPDECIVKEENSTN